MSPLPDCRKKQTPTRPKQDTGVGAIFCFGQNDSGRYQFRQRLKHANVKPPTMAASKDEAKLPPDNQAPIITPMVMLASNQKIQIGKLFMADRPFRGGLAAQTWAKVSYWVKAAELRPQAAQPVI